MPFNGSGTFSPHSPEYPVVAGTTIKASDWNTIVSDIATGLTNAICRDGQSSPSANINWGGVKLTNLANGTAAGDAVNFGQMTGRLLNFQTFAATAVYTATPGTTRVIIELVGGGGAGGGTLATGAGQLAAGSGGSGGGYSRSQLIAGFSGATVTIGAGGVAVNGANGGNGGTTSFGGVFSATGGGGGQVGNVSPTTSSTFTAPPSAGAGVAGTLMNNTGHIGTAGIYMDSGVALGGNGGGSYFGGGGLGNQTNNGAAGPSSGSGGSGAASGVSTAARIGGTGGTGYCIIWEFA